MKDQKRSAKHVGGYVIHQDRALMEAEDRLRKQLRDTYIEFAKLRDAFAKVGNDSEHWIERHVLFEISVIFTREFGDYETREMFGDFGPRTPSNFAVNRKFRLAARYVFEGKPPKQRFAREKAEENKNCRRKNDGEAARPRRTLCCNTSGECSRIRHVSRLF
jgi:hypothetical protein